MRTALILAAAAVTTNASPCPVLEHLNGVQCYGLDRDASASTDAARCRDICCASEACEVWQFNPEYGCFRGSAHVCVRTADRFCQGSIGERLRGGLAGGSGRVWSGQRRNYAELVDMDPYSHGPQVEETQGLDGEIYHVRRSGPGRKQLQIAVSCWSQNRHPDWCCPGGAFAAKSCWAVPGIQDHCCKEGQSADGSMLYSVFVSLTQHLTPVELQQFHELFPGSAINEDAFESTRQRFRVGTHSPGVVCASGSVALGHHRGTIDSAAVLWPLLVLMASFEVPISGTFINIGAGTCEPPDPLYQLLASPQGQGFIGLAVESNWSRLQRCETVMAKTPGRVVPVHMTMDPTAAADQLQPHLKTIFRDVPKPWPLDFLVVDIDGVDCRIVEELLQIVTPKVIHLEIVFHIPPPFRFSLQWDIDQSPRWDEEYDVDVLNPASGCSLSYALHKFRPHGYFLLRLTPNDVVLVHKSIAPVVEQGLKLKLPQDEFECYRNSTLWLQMPAEYVREWFYAKHPSAAIGYIWSNISSLNKEIGRQNVPFTLDF